MGNYWNTPSEKQKCKAARLLQRMKTAMKTRLCSRLRSRGSAMMKSRAVLYWQLYETHGACTMCRTKISVISQSSQRRTTTKMPGCKSCKQRLTQVLQPTPPVLSMTKTLIAPAAMSPAMHRKHLQRSEVPIWSRHGTLLHCQRRRMQQHCRHRECLQPHTDKSRCPSAPFAG